MKDGGLGPEEDQQDSEKQQQKNNIGSSDKKRLISDIGRRVLLLAKQACEDSGAHVPRVHWTLPVCF